MPSSVGHRRPPRAKRHLTIVAIRLPFPQQPYEGSRGGRLEAVGYHMLQGQRWHLQAVYTRIITEGAVALETKWFHACGSHAKRLCHPHCHPHCHQTSPKTMIPTAPSRLCEVVPNEGPRYEHRVSHSMAHFRCEFGPETGLQLIVARDRSANDRLTRQVCK